MGGKRELAVGLGGLSGGGVGIFFWPANDLTTKHGPTVLEKILADADEVSLSMRSFWDVAVIIGAGSQEKWHLTGMKGDAFDADSATILDKFAEDGIAVIDPSALYSGMEPFKSGSGEIDHGHFAK